MKKLLCLLLCLALPLAALAETAPLTEDDFVLTVDGTAYALGENPEALLAALEALTGAPLAMTESVSCMFDGMDREYENEAVLVGTYPIGGEVSESIIVSTDALTTARGAMVGMTTADIEALYGEPDLLDWDTMLYYLLGAPDHEPYLIFGFDLDTGVITYWIAGWGTFV